MPFEVENAEEEIPVSPEEFLRQQKRAIRNKSWWAIGIGLLIIIASTAALLLAVTLPPEYLEGTRLAGKSILQLLFRNIFFLLGLFFLIGGVYGLYSARRLSLDDLIPSEEAIEFLEQVRGTRAVYSLILVGCLVAVTLVQLRTETVESVFQIGEQSAEIAGLVKPLVWQGEWWRILTSATLHGIFPLHLYFNAQALYGFGALIEVLANRAHLAIVFVLSVVGGGLLSLFFMPDITSIGASGGIMGLIGYLAVYGYRRRSQLPPDFLRSMLINIGFIAAFGVIAYQIVDNFGHLGGLLTGGIYGLVQIPRDLAENPRRPGVLTKVFGVIALGIFILTCLFSIGLLTRYIHG